MKFTSSVILALVAAVSAAPTQLSKRAVPVYNIHPNGDTTKCIGILGGQFVSGAAIDMCVITPLLLEIRAHLFYSYDCNGSASQKWFLTSGPRTTNPADGSTWAFDVPGSVGDPNFHLVSGTKVVLKPDADGGEDGSPTQSWNGKGSPQEPQIRINAATANDGDQCLDLTDGKKTNRNPLQLWACTPGNTNQKWTYTTV
jgi:hypothetical protein